MLSNCFLNMPIKHAISNKHDILYNINLKMIAILLHCIVTFSLHTSGYSKYIILYTLFVVMILFDRISFENPPMSPEIFCSIILIQPGIEIGGNPRSGIHGVRTFTKVLKDSARILSRFNIRNLVLLRVI